MTSLIHNLEQLHSPEKPSFHLLWYLFLHCICAHCYFFLPQLTNGFFTAVVLSFMALGWMSSLHVWIGT